MKEALIKIWDCNFYSIILLYLVNSQWKHLLIIIIIIIIFIVVLVVY